MTRTKVADRELQLCRCGHIRLTHEHHRSGDDCGLCGPVGCASFHAVAPRGDAKRALTRPG